ncbi:hypothetical protein Tco_0071667 [Tanacetum coccineum]
MDYVKKSIEKRALHKMEYDRRHGTESQEQDTSSRSGNDAHVDDADIRPIYNEEPMAEERHSPLAQQRLKVNPQMVQMQISLTNVKANKLLMSVQVRIYQKSQENSQKMGKHGHENGRVHKSQKQSQEKVNP